MTFRFLLELGPIKQLYIFAFASRSFTSNSSKFDGSIVEIEGGWSKDPLFYPMILSLFQYEIETMFILIGKKTIIYLIYMVCFKARGHFQNSENTL